MPIQTYKQTPSIDSSDKSLIEQALLGNQDAFDALVHRYSTPLLEFACAYLGDYDQACDVLQHVLLQLYLSLPTLHAYMLRLRNYTSLKTWLFQITRNRCIDELRRKRHMLFSELESAENEEARSLLEMIPDPRPLPEQIVEQHDLQCMLQRAIRSLPSRYRSVVYLRYAWQMTFEEIGLRLNMPESTAKTYFQRARPLLRAALAL